MSDLVKRLRKSYVSTGANYVQEAADALEAKDAEIERLRVVVQAATQLCDNVEEWECDGLGLFAQHGWWEPLHDALEAMDEAAHEGEQR